jgi:hypothetical protein
LFAKLSSIFGKKFWRYFLSFFFNIMSTSLLFYGSKNISHQTLLVVVDVLCCWCCCFVAVLFCCYFVVLVFYCCVAVVVILFLFCCIIVVLFCCCVVLYCCCFIVVLCWCVMLLLWKRGFNFSIIAKQKSISSKQFWSNSFYIGNYYYDLTRKISGVCDLITLTLTGL